MKWTKSHKLNYDFLRIEYFGVVRHILSRIATRKATILSLSSSKMSVLRRWDDLDSSNEEEVTIDETSYIEIW